MPPVRLVLWTISLAGFLCLGCVIAGWRPPLAVPLGGLLLQVCVATLGVLAPRLSVYADVVSCGLASRAEVALTFDDGPHPVTTRRVLALLQEHGVKATFFVLGEKVAAHPEVVREVVAAGHALGLHGYSHDRLYALRSARRVRDDLERAAEIVERATGVRARLFRPPVGFVSHGVGLAAERAGFTLVGFSARTRDGLAGAEPNAVLARACAALESGAILLLHDAAEVGDRAPASLSVLGELCVEIARRGLRPVTVDSLLRGE